MEEIEEIEEKEIKELIKWQHGAIREIVDLCKRLPKDKQKHLITLIKAFLE